MNSPLTSVSAPAAPVASFDPEDVGTIRNLAEPLPPDAELERPELLEELGRSDPASAERLRKAMHQFPIVGNWFAGFELVALLGRGAFGRVYLARQGNLADRFVALKVSTDLTGESRTLARLQHTNIVPIYSSHRVAPFQAVCMPYFGATTLAHLLARYRGLRSLPASGRQLVDTLCGLNDVTDAPSARSSPASSRGTGGTGTGAAQEREPAGGAGALPPRTGSRGFLSLLRTMSYTEAVCWIGAQLADGLGHAHAEGFIHNDLKPANVLLTDEGRPMLLDFGVAEEVALRSTAPVARIGGTLPFMAPEHLVAIESGKFDADHRGDLYGLGIILFEMLTGQHPFRLPTGETKDEVPKMLAERRAGAPRLRAINPGVTPGLEAIVRKCLEPDPARRYQSAVEIREDLERHRADQPLLHVRVPSARERLTKWARRHPRLTSSLSLLTAALVVIGLMATGLYARNARIERLEAAEAAQAIEIERLEAAEKAQGERFRAVETSRALDDTLRAVRFRLSARPSDPQEVGATVGGCEAALARYGLPGDSAWAARPTFGALLPDEQRRVRAQLAEACVLLARGTALTAKPGDGEAEQLGRAAEWNALAERVSGVDAPRVVWEQRAAILRRLGKAEEADRAAERAKEAPLQTARDYYLSGAEALAGGRLKDARDLFARAVELDPAYFWAHTGLGAAYQGMGQFTAAVPYFDTAIALQPDASWGYYHRGLLAVHMKEYEKATTAFDRAAERNPDHADTYLHRAVAAQWRKKYDEALKDLDRAVAAGAPKTRAAFMRARVYDLSGDKEAAKRELDAALKGEPTDELTWIARANARVTADPAGAIQDFDAALAVNPRSMVALQNKAFVLSRLGKPEEALKVLDRVVELYPDFVAARADRGVMNARLKKWDAAAADAADALKRDQTPRNLFQVAAIHALLSQTDAAHTTEAVRLVSAALRAGFGFDHVETDKDLDPIRATPEFKRVLDGVRAIARP
jgi:serine/threonine protein kinase/Tfp pilus assembly protein PilF